SRKTGPRAGPPGVRARATAAPCLPSVITETGLDIHRYICSGWFGPTSQSKLRANLHSGQDASGTILPAVGPSTSLSLRRPSGRPRKRCSPAMPSPGAGKPAPAHPEHSVTPIRLVPRPCSSPAPLNEGPNADSALTMLRIALIARNCDGYDDSGLGSDF